MSSRNRTFDWPAMLQVAIETGAPLDPLGDRPNADLRLMWESAQADLPGVPADVIRSSLLNAGETADPNGLSLRGLRVEGDLDLNFATLEYPLRMSMVHMDGDLMLTSFRGTDVHLSEVSLRSLKMDQVRIENSFLGWKLTTDGNVQARGGVFGSFELFDSTIRPKGPSQVAVNVPLANVPGNFSLRGSRLHGELYGVGVQIAGSLILSDSEIREASVQVASAKRPSGASSDGEFDAICLDSAQIGGLLDARDASIHGAFLARGARIGGQLRLSGVKMGSKTAKRYPLDFDGMRVENGADFEGMVAKSLSLTGAMVRQLSLRNADLSRDRHGYAVYADDVQVTQDILLGGSALRGVLSLRGARVGRGITTSENPMRLTKVRLTDCEVGGDVSIAQRSDASMAADRAHVKGELRLDEWIGSSIPQAKGGRRISISAHGAMLAHVHVDLGSRPASVDFSDASIGILEVGEGQEEGALTRLVISDTTTWVVRTIRGDIASDWRRARDLLSAGADDDFHAQPWFEVAEVFERSGHESDARRLKFNATDRLFARRRSWFGRHVWRRITKATIGHGYYSQGALAWLLLLWVSAASMTALHPSAFSPTDRSAAVISMVEPSAEGTVERLVITDASSQPVPPAYPEFVPALYAVDVVLSPLGTGQSDAWRVSSDPWFSGALTAIKLLSWGMLGLFVTGVSGVINRR